MCALSAPSKALGSALVKKPNKMAILNLCQLSNRPEGTNTSKFVLLKYTHESQHTACVTVWYYPKRGKTHAVHLLIRQRYCAAAETMRPVYLKNNEWRRRRSNRAVRAQWAASPWRICIDNNVFLFLKKWGSVSEYNNQTLFMVQIICK